MLQINRGRMVRWNPLLLAILFLLFVYGTFLTSQWGAGGGLGSLV